jgi:hypothetical protein
MSTLALLRGMRLTATHYQALRRQVDDAFPRDIVWSQTVTAPASADDLASEAIFVICNSGMRATVARPIYEKVMAALQRGEGTITVFKHPHKAKSIDTIWTTREALLASFLAATDRLAWCDALPHIGGITKFHLAKNLGVDCAKPDRWLVRVAQCGGETVDALCQRLAHASGDRVATVDYVIWRSCEQGWLTPLPDQQSATVAVEPPLSGYNAFAALISEDPTITEVECIRALRDHVSADEAAAWHRQWQMLHQALVARIGTLPGVLTVVPDERAGVHRLVRGTGSQAATCDFSADAAVLALAATAFNHLFRLPTSVAERTP